MTDSPDSTIAPFRIDIPQTALDDLHRRLDAARWPEELPDVGWAYGTPLSYLQDLAGYWRAQYNWREHEAALNKIPQFITEIDGQRVHFLHVRSPEPHALPLILTHGWPGSVVEFVDLIGPLTDPAAHGGDRADAFDVVIPALPGFGFSGPTHETGWNIARIARAWSELMRRLNYSRCGAQGEDMGAFISPELGRVVGEQVAGVHVNAASYGFIPLGEVPEDELATFTAAERGCLERLRHWYSDENGYFQIQSTRPQTLSYGLTDSPIGQLGWIMEKFKEMTYPFVWLPEAVIDRDRLLTNAMFYWLTGTAGSAARLYYENMHVPTWSATPGTTPTGVAVFARDCAIRRYAERGHNIVHWSQFESGGHFAALEAPELLTADVREFFRPLR